MCNAALRRILRPQCFVLSPRGRNCLFYLSCALKGVLLVLCHTCISLSFQVPYERRAHPFVSALSAYPDYVCCAPWLDHSTAPNPLMYTENSIELGMHIVVEHLGSPNSHCCTRCDYALFTADSLSCTEMVASYGKVSLCLLNVVIVFCAPLVADSLTCPLIPFILIW